MFDFLKRKPAAETDPAPKNNSWFSRLKQGLTKTRSSLTDGLANLFLGKKVLDQALIEDIENVLLGADIGVATTQQLINSLTQKLARKELDNPEAAFKCLQEDMLAIMRPCESEFVISTDRRPNVILMVGINGAGKTTTIGKLAAHYKQQGQEVILAAGDTFRAAAIEQLKAWGDRNQVPVIAQQPGADTAAVIYDAMEAAKARGMNILLADTAGRLHTQDNLMTELQKVKRVLGKIDPTAPHEVLLVLDASLGQNAINQVKQFNDAIGVTGLVITKLDGTAKGGALFAIANQTRLPIRFIGVGEGIEDLRAFRAEEFIKAIF